MPDCEFNASQLLTRKAFNNALDKASNTNATILDEIGQSMGSLLAGISSQGGGLLDSAVGAAVDSIVADTLSNLSSLGVSGGLSTVGTMIATLLSGGQTAYLGLAAYLMTLLEIELEQRIEISLIIQEDMELIKRLLSYLQSIFNNSDSDNMLKELQQAYKHIVNSTSAMGEVSSILENRKYFSLNKAIYADRELSYAKDKMKTPILDSILEVVTTSGFATDGILGQHLNLVEAKTKPDVIWARINGDNTSFKKIESDRSKSRTTKEEQIDILLAGLSEYTNVPFGALLVGGELANIAKKLKTDLSKYLPLSLTGVMSPAGDVVGAVLTGGLSTNKLLEFSRKRTLYSLNSAIELKITNLSKYKESWNGLNKLTSVLLPLVNRVVVMLIDLQADVGKYAGVEATEKIGSGAVLALRMSIWKRQIDTIQTNINTLKSAGEQSQNIGQAYDSLNTLMVQIQERSLVYTEGVPESELAYDYIFKVLGELLDAILGNSSISKLESKIAESLTSLKISVATDKALLNQIKTYQGSALAIPGLRDMVMMTSTLLDKDKYKNSLLATVVTGIRNGDLANLANISMAAVTSGTEIAKTVSGTVVNGVRNNEADTGNPIFDAVLESMGAMYSDLGDCFAKIMENNEPAKLVQIEALKASSEKVTLYAEGTKHAEKELLHIDKIINEQELATKGESIYPEGLSSEDYDTLNNICAKATPGGYHVPTYYMYYDEDGQ